MSRPSLAIPLVILSALLIAAAPASPRTAPTRVVEDQGYRVRLDLGPQVLSILVPEDWGDSNEAAISPTLARTGEGLVSGSMLAQKAKQFDDGLYAAVEIAAQEGAGTFAGKAAMLRALAARMSSGPRGPDAGNAAAVLLSACRLGKVPVQVPTSLQGEVAAAEREFLADPLRSKPLGYYTWSPALADIFRQDRMLQAELKGAGGIERLAGALAADPGSKAAYEAYRTLVDRLTNPAASEVDFRGALLAIEQRRPRDLPRGGVAVFPASRSREGDLIKKLFGDRPVPEGFSLVDEMIRRIRSGQIVLKPTERSGWYDYQTWALEPLVVPETMPESARLMMEDDYRKQLLDLFKGVLALTRETHVKQLLVPTAPAAAPFDGPPSKPPVIIDIAPELSAEPLVTYYRRRATSYEFIRKSLLATFGGDGLKAMHRRTAAGPVATDLATELEAIRALFGSAAATTARQLGMTDGPGSGTDEAAFRSWAKAADRDPDLGRDARMMVPIFHDQKRLKTRVWAFLGWSRRPVVVRFATPPSHEVSRDGRKLDAGDAPQVRFVPASHDLAYPVTAEVYVDELLDRDQFRKHCDTYKTRAAILAHLK